MSKRAVLLVNLGSPDAPTVPAVRRYLHQFLMDPYVIQLPWLLRKIIVCLFVLPTRPKSSAQAYQSVWTESGSPLIVLSEQLRDALAKQIDLPVEIAMRYGHPSIEQQLLKLANQGYDDILFIPLYPHYAQSTITTAIEAAQHTIKKHQLAISLDIPAPFYADSDYISALVQSAEPYLQQPFDHLLFSYHGLPESHIAKLDPSGQHVFEQEACCNGNEAMQEVCYHHQVWRTTHSFVEQTGLQPHQYSLAFQSRLGRQKWLGPSTEDKLIELAHAGVKHVLVICPAFVTDCLETLEEIAIRGTEVFQQAGGEKLTLIPCMNSHPAWVNVLKMWCSSDSTN